MALGYKVYRKPTHTNLYLNAKSHHHPSNKQAVLSTLIHRAKALCDEDSLQAELVFLKDVFKENGYNDRQFHRALNHRPLLPQPDNKPHSVAFLRFVGTVFNRISRVLARHNIKSVGLPHMRLSSLLRLVKDHVGLRTPGLYRIPSPRKPDIWTALSGRPLRLNSTLTISTERVASVSVNHGSLLSAP
jgi:hypothetical protein